MIYGYIYKITNKINNKVYIGQTIKSVEQRFRGHCNSAKRLKQHPERYKRPCEIHSAINKYGVENFVVDTIDTAETKQELNEKEIYWISYYDSTNLGYNMTIGGDTNPMFQEKTKEAHDEKMRSHETRAKISESMKKMISKNGFSDEHRRRLSEAQKDRKCFFKDGKRTYTAGANTDKIAELLSDGWVMYTKQRSRNIFATRSRAVYCLLNNEERHDFASIIEAGKWWYDNYKPFGDIYSVATYQRKIEKSIAGEVISYGNKTHKKYKIIDNIKWFYV